ncbi:hypothetical protein [Mycobacterium sp. M23085]|uniref:hypothetical protein n=1 Tax=Mycobacterium sp. M23085 TaxID=3378087 RepID=UPI003877D0FB
MASDGVDDHFMHDSSYLVAVHPVENPAAYLKCGHCQRLTTKATAVIRQLPGIDVVLCHDCQFERIATGLLVACTKVEEGNPSAVA